jgi:hypothetical protein
LTLHTAHRRAEADLRRFKASAEFVNPDVYEREQDGGGNGRKQADSNGRKQKSNKEG